MMINNNNNNIIIALLNKPVGGLSILPSNPESLKDLKYNLVFPSSPSNYL